MNTGELSSFLAFNASEIERLQNRYDETQERISAAQSELEMLEMKIKQADALLKKAKGQNVTIGDDESVSDDAFLFDQVKHLLPTFPMPPITQVRTPSGDPERPIPVMPIALIDTDFRKRFEAPRQPFVGVSSDARIRVTDPRHVEELSAVEGAPHELVWIIYCFDRNAGRWREFVQPPRAKGTRRALFTTRSPNRPNPVGLTLARLESFARDGQGLSLRLSGTDILSQTPLLALKPYDPATESHPHARCGWVDGKDLSVLYHDVQTRPQQSPLGPAAQARYTVTIPEACRAKLAWIDRTLAVDAMDYIVRSLEVDPTLLQANRPRRRTRLPQPRLGPYPLLALAAYRVLFQVDHAGHSVEVVDVVSGFRPEVLASDQTTDPEIREHLAFMAAFPPRRQEHR